MKSQNIILAFALMLLDFCASGQSFIYDQQSSTTDANAFGGYVLQDYVPSGQSFTAGLSGIDFVQLAFYDYQAGNGLGVAVYVNLRTASITGPILATTALVSMPDGYGIGSFNAAPTLFYFQSTIGLTPGTTYFLEPVVQSGDLFGISAQEYNYIAGTSFLSGHAAPGGDLWFREGIVVPEPSAGALTLLGAGALWWFRRKRAAI